MLHHHLLLVATEYKLELILLGQVQTCLQLLLLLPPTPTGCKLVLHGQIQVGTFGHEHQF
jgi:hypothetical protein